MYNQMIKAIIGFLVGFILAPVTLVALDLTAFTVNASGPAVAAQGYAAVANASGLDAIADNPALLYRTPDTTVTARIQQFSAFETHWLTVDCVFPDYATGMRYVRSNTPDIMRTAQQNGVVVDTQERYSVNNQAFYLSTLLIATERMYVGASARFIEQVIDEDKLSGYTSVLGWSWQVRDRLRVGATLDNLVSSSFKWTRTSLTEQSLKRYVKGGAAVSFFSERLTVAAQVQSNALTSLADVHVGMQASLPFVDVMVGTHQEALTVGTALHLPTVSLAVAYVTPGFFDKQKQVLELAYFKFAFQLRLGARDRMSRMGSQRQVRQESEW